jgi:UDP-glucuronate 4-epimerase
MAKALNIESGYHIFNLGESKTTALKDLIGLIEAALGKKARIEPLPLQPGDVEITYADVNRAKKMLGYQPGTTMADGIQKFVSWYRKHNG